MTLTCAKCKRSYVLPLFDPHFVAIAMRDQRPFVCDACWEMIMQEAAERIRIKVR